MRKSKKEVTQEERAKPQKIEVEFKSGKLFFKGNGKDFYLDKEDAAFLFGRNILRRLEQTTPEDDFLEFQTVETLAKWRFSTSRGITVNEFCKAQGFNAYEFKRWIGTKSKMIKDLMTTRKAEIAAEVERLEKENPLPISQPEERKEFIPKNPPMKAKEVARLMKEGEQLRAIAEKFKVDYSMFIRWYSSPAIQKIITQNLRAIADEQMRAEEEAKEQSEITVLG